jgi:hypothetical protein
MCPLWAFYLQRKPKVAYEFALLTGTCHSILPHDPNMQWIAKKSVCHLVGVKVKIESCHCVSGPSQSTPTKPTTLTEAQLLLSLSDTCAPNEGKGIS